MPFDENIVCPTTGEPLEAAREELVSPSGARYPLTDGIPRLFVDEPRGSIAQQPAAKTVTHAVQDFYEDAPFPNYNSFDTLATFVRQANVGFPHLLRNQIPLNASVLEIGCGTA